MRPHEDLCQNSSLFNEWTYGLPKKVHLEIKSTAESQDFHMVSFTQSDSY
jgi:hypothetical protein